jgi:tetratricopeptide (TPR) repeat protein
MRNIERGHVKEDEFQSLMQKAIKYIVKHRENAIWGVVMVIAAVVVVVYLSSRNEAVKPEAELMQTQAISLITMGRIADAQNMFTQLSEKYPSTRPGKISLYYLGVISFSGGKFAEALTFFNRYLGKDKDDFLLSGSAFYAAGCCAEGMKDYEKALVFYRKAAGNKKSPYYHQALLASGRLEGMLGNKDQAKEILRKLLELNPAQDVANDAKYYLGYFN